MKIHFSKWTMALLLLSFFVGFGIAFVRHRLKDTSEEMAAVSLLQEETNSWGLGFGSENSETQPTGNATPDELKEFDTYYVGNKKDKVIYLTFDCGYENGNTPAILDALKKQDVKATFFVVGHYLESAKDLVKRMAEEGHTVGNHTYHHPKMSAISSKDSFQKELEDVCSLYRSITGEEMPKYYRPPRGEYSTENLRMAKELGYKTFLLSLAYVDWKDNDQPEPPAAIRKLTGRIHPGAVVLLHNTSSTNGKILEELIKKWKDMGYTFAPLSELIKEE